MDRVTITNGLLHTGDRVLAPASVVIDGQSIAWVGKQGIPDGLRGGKTIDARGRLITPGLINAHTHIYSALARGIPLKDPPPTSFREILERLWWRLDRALTVADTDLAARLHGSQCLHHGVTTVFDHHASQSRIRGSLRTIAGALQGLGLRACLCFEVSDRAGGAGVAEAIGENADLIAHARERGGDLLRARFGLHASLTLSDDTLRACADACAAAGDPESIGYHVHVAEDRCDQEDARDRHATTVLERFAARGILGPRTICVHGVHLGDRELALLAETGTWLVHCAQSNMNNAVGAAALQRPRASGVRLALGTDGFTAAILREALVAHLLQNHVSGDPQAGYLSVPELLLEGNYALARETFGLNLGRLEPGAPADLVVWNYRAPTPLTADTFWGHILFGLVDAHADEVFVAGRHVLAAGRSTTCDEEQLADDCRRAAKDLWERF